MSANGPSNKIIVSHALTLLTSTTTINTAAIRILAAATSAAAAKGKAKRDIFYVKYE
jgi:hypothetical protein